MSFLYPLRALLTGIAVAGGLAAAAPASAPQLAALTKIEGGRWQFREANANVPARLLCVADPAALIQLNHPGAICSHLVIADTPDTATVQYMCGGSGRGRTTIAVETPRLIHLQTQGFAAGAPFDVDYEARRLGSCGTQGRAR